MTYKETMAAMAYLKANYPNSFKGQTKEEAQMVIRTWEDVLKDYPSELVRAAIKAFISTDTKGFMPVPGELIAIINSQNESDEMTPQEAWNLVRSKIDFYGAKEHYNSLPEDIQAVLGDVEIGSQYLRDLHVADASILNVAASNFMKSYQIHMARKKQNAAIPKNIMLELKKIPCLEKPDEAL